MENLLKLFSGEGQVIHFIGIGGSGMYPLVQILHTMNMRNMRGFILTGSDNNETDTVEAVRKMGIEVRIGHSADNITSDVTAIVRSAAIKDDNVEVITARSLGIPIIERADLLGAITNQYSKAICVAGTHGKTTVSSMIATILMSSHDPEIADISAVIGGKLKILDNGSGRAGGGDIMVCEACEYADTFLKLSPNISVILNIDSDHLEYFKTMENLRLSFTKFCKLTSDTIIINADDENSMLAVKGGNFSGKTVTFGLSDSSGYHPKNITGGEFDLCHRKTFLTHIKLNVPGEHNILNAVAACAAAHLAGADVVTLAKGLERFTGAGRRFEILAEIGGITIADDYAHHPAEVTATLRAALSLLSLKSLHFKRVWAIHQPFTYSRTASMLDEFAKALSLADKVTLTEIMGGREVDAGVVCADDLAVKVSELGKDCNKLSTFEEVADYVVLNAQSGDLIITMGCGDINKAAHMIVGSLQNQHQPTKNN